MNSIRRIRIDDIEYTTTNPVIAVCLSDIREFPTPDDPIRILWRRDNRPETVTYTEYRSILFEFPWRAKNTESWTTKEQMESNRLQFMLRELIENEPCELCGDPTGIYPPLCGRCYYLIGWAQNRPAPFPQKNL